MNRAQKLRSKGYLRAEIAKVLGITERQVRRRLLKDKPKPISYHQTDTDYLKDVAQIPDEAALMMHRGGQPTTELEAECDRVIWQEATVQIREVAPLRNERFMLRLPKIVKVLGGERR